MNATRVITLAAIFGLWTSGLFIPRAHGQDAIYIAEQGGVTLTATPTEAPEGFSAAILSLSSPEGSKMTVFEDLLIGTEMNRGPNPVQTWTSGPFFTPTILGPLPPLPTFLSEWAPYDSHLLLTKEMLGVGDGSGLSLITENNDSSIGSLGLPTINNAFRARIGRGEISTLTALGLEPDFQSNSVDFARIIVPATDSRPIPFSLGVVGEGIVNSGQPDGAFFDKVPLDIHAIDPPSFCETSRADSCFDFDTEPEGLTITTVGGDSTEWRPSGGILDSGYLSVTDAEIGQAGTIIVPDVGNGLSFVLAGRTGGANGVHHVDNLEVSVSEASLSVSVSLRVGAGTDRPADGFSISLVRPHDPVLVDGTTFAGWGGEESLPEEGTRTGLSIGFDEWTSGDDQQQLDLGGNPVGQDLEGISIRLEGRLLAQEELPTRNGALDDITSLQTGPNGGGIDALGWATLTVDMTDIANFANFCGSSSFVSWKGNTVIVPFWFGPDHQTVSCVPEPKTSPLLIFAIPFGLLLRQRWGRENQRRRET